MRFSERIGIKKAFDIIQKECMSTELRNSLWNIIYMIQHEDHSYEFIDNLQNSLYVRFFKKPLDEKSQDGYYEIKQHIMQDEWFDVYDLIEFIADYLNNISVHHTGLTWSDFIKCCNVVLKRENSAYRIVEGKFVEIIDENEISEIETAMEQTPYSAIKVHFSSALEKLSDKKKPDYRNSIKESISAVEAIARKITGESTLGGAFKKLNKGEIKIPKVLQEGMEKIYHFTNGTDGIRHALMNEEKLGFAEAKYMLVTCSAFVNYLTAKMIKGNKTA